MSESGFKHSAYTFAHEANLFSNDSVNELPRQVPPGALITMVHKGINSIDYW